MSPSVLPTDLPSYSSIPSMFPTRDPSESPSTKPSSNPSLQPSNIHSSLPSLHPTTLHPNACPSDGFLGRTFKSVVFDKCWIFELFAGGNVKVDPTDSTCSKTTPHSSTYVLTEYKQNTSNKIVFKTITGATESMWEVYIQILEDTELTKESLELTKLGWNTNELVFTLTVPDCASSEPSSKPSSMPSSEPSYKRSNSNSAPSIVTYNVAVCKPASQSSTDYGGSANRAVGGNANGYFNHNSVTHTWETTNNPWWKVDLEKVYKVERIEVYNRSESCCMDRIIGFVVEVYQGEISDSNRVYSSSTLSITGTAEYVYNFDLSSEDVSGDIVVITIPGDNKIISLAQVLVYSEEVDANPRVPPLCTVPSSELHAVSSGPTHKLGHCEGDCDNDSDCSGSLVCFQRNRFTKVPGCLGDGIEDYDYCADPNPEITLHGDSDNPTYGELGHCEGDCDKNSDCSGSLVCFQRNRFTKVPGCLGDGIENQDYCYVMYEARK
jgi:hypothetical protein